MSAPDSSTTVERSIALLWELYAAPDGLTVSELARRLQTQRTALYRLLRPFLRTQFIRRGDNKRYYLGFGITALARAVAQPIEVLTTAALQRLADVTGCAAMIIANTDDILVTVASATPQRTGMYVVAPVGFVHENNDVAQRAIASATAPTFREEVATEDGEPGFVSNGDGGGRATTIAVPFYAPLIGTPACILVASLSPFDESATADLLRGTVVELTGSSSPL